MSYRQLLFFPLYLLYTCCLVAQDPSYRVLGEAFFEDKDIYSILEDRDQNIWVGTDAGLVCYNGNDFKLLSSDGLTSQAVFHLLMDNNGQIYYYNLNGQIVEVVGDSLALFFQVPEAFVSGGYSFHFDDNNDLIVYAKALLKVNADKSVEVLYHSDEFRQGGHITKKKNGTLALVLKLNPLLLGEWRENKLTYINCPNNLEKEFLDPQIFSIQNQEIIMDRKKEQVLKNVEKNWSQIPLSKNGNYCSSFLNGFFINKNQLWLSCREKGAYVLDLEGNLLFADKILQDYIISQVIQDESGNIWVGTFKRGLLVIPTLDVVNFEKHPIFKEHKISCIEKGNNGVLYLATDNGTIYQMDSNHEISTVIEHQQQDLMDLFFFKEDEILYWDGGLFDLKTNTFRTVKKVTIKDMAPINQDELIIAMTSGVVTLNRQEEHPFFRSRLQKYTNLIEVDSTAKYSRLKLSRSSAIHYDSLKKEIWVGTSSNLLLLNENGDTVRVVYNNKPISTNSIVQYGERIFAAVSGGVLVFENGQVVKAITSKDGLLFTRITKLACQNNYLYISTDKAFQRINLSTNELQTFSELDGFLNTTIFDFVVEKPFVWLATGRGLQRFDRTIFEQKNKAPSLTFLSVSVNDKVINIKEQGVFDYDQNKINVEFLAQSYLSKDAFHYEYRLKGTEEQWEELNANQSSVLYNALDAGSYSFEVKTVDMEGNESPVINYDFSIAVPYWETWWFFLLCVLGVACAVALFFLIRIRILKEQNQLLLEKKAIEKELVESRQTALRSQMNPHFLFNALNSIQEMIMVNEKNRAGQYLGKFADLMRMYLNQSRKKSIVLSQELDALKLYLDLEKVRFEDSLNIQFEVASNLDVEAVSIPPMLIQPYVENAFKHGLLHKEKHRLLQIHFKYQSTTNLVLCIIEDNGVGRAKSAEINRQRDLYHESFSTSATQNRLDLLNYNKKYPIQVEILDLKDGHGKASGTKVILQIPVYWEVSTED